jgi:hypothetical protein
MSYNHNVSLIDDKTEHVKRQSFCNARLVGKTAGAAHQATTWSKPGRKTFALVIQSQDFGLSSNSGCNIHGSGSK